MALIELDGVSVTFPPRGRRGEPVRAVQDVSLSVEAGEIVGIVGYSGAGKSTLLRVVNALEKATTGRVVVDGVDLTTLPERELNRVRRGIGMIFQQFNLFTSRTVYGNIAYPLEIAGRSKQEQRERVSELLHFVGLLDQALAYPEQLSGGQKQRVGIARALAAGPAILLADEATSALDPETTVEVLDLLKRINTELGVTVLVITHEMEVVKTIADRIVVMEEGRIVESDSAFRIFSAPSTPRPGASCARSSTTSRRTTTSSSCGAAIRAASSRCRSARTPRRSRRCSARSSVPGSSSSSSTAASRTSAAAASDI